jgi:hypothetical protein
MNDIGGGAYVLDWDPANGYVSGTMVMSIKEVSYIRLF